MNIDLWTLIAIVYFLSMAYCLFKIARMPKSNTNALWALVVILIPFIGAAVFLAFVPKQPEQ